MGELISAGHRCAPPNGQLPGALYRCDCGVLSVLQSNGWVGCSIIEEALVLMNHRLKQARRPTNL